MLMRKHAAPVTWTVPNEPNAVRRLVRKLEREAPVPVQACYEACTCKLDRACNRRARCPGSPGISGNGGNVESVTYRF